MPGSHLLRRAVLAAAALVLLLGAYNALNNDAESHWIQRESAEIDVREGLVVVEFTAPRDAPRTHS